MTHTLIYFFLPESQGLWSNHGPQFCTNESHSIHYSEALKKFSQHGCKEVMLITVYTVGLKLLVLYRSYLCFHKFTVLYTNDSSCHEKKKKLSYFLWNKENWQDFVGQKKCGQTAERSDKIEKAQICELGPRISGSETATLKIDCSGKPGLGGPQIQQEWRKYKKKDIQRKRGKRGRDKNPRKKVEAKKKEINKRKRPNKTKLKYSKVEKENNEKKWSIKKI